MIRVKELVRGVAPPLAAESVVSESPRFRRQITFTAVLLLLLIWVLALAEVHRSQEEELRDARLRTLVQSQVFAEYSRSTIKRINQVILDLRGKWKGDWAAFSEAVKTAQQNIDDLTFQTGLIDRNGIVAYSNLSKPTDPKVDLSEREHFQVHRNAGDADNLFISRPVKGRVSGKWSIQVTRPILRQGRFDGVMVISLDPAKFAGFGQSLRLSETTVMTVVRSTGEIMARYPDPGDSLGVKLTGRPFQPAGAPTLGNYRMTGATDGVDRIWGYHSLPEYGLTFVIGEAVDDVLAAHGTYRNFIVLIALGLSALLSALFYLLFQSMRTVEEMGGQLNVIFSLSPDGIVSFDSSQRLVYVSPAFEAITGLKRAEVLQLSGQEFFDLLRAQSAPGTSFPALKKSRAGDQDDQPDPDTVFEYLIPHKRTIQMSLRKSRGGNVSYILYFRDITRESELDRMKSEFLSTAAHELRTPMASIYGFVEILSTREFPPAEMREYLDIVLRQSRLMITIINELLDLVRIESRRGADFRFETLEAREFVLKVVQGFMPPDGRSGPLTLIPPGDHFIRADQEKLMQAVGNVLSNAYKYSSQGTPVEIELVCGDEAHPGMTGVRITDHGIGMNGEQLARVGERFYRADDSGQVPGTGLGMSIVGEIVNLSQGKVELESEPGRGTRVTLWLPGPEEAVQALPAADAGEATPA
jgi:PAS domain S-box-containing protein